ncbi:MAG: M20 family metallopeptidase [Bacteroidales bacterium]|nr:M20 family metallopeptidase [Bacteroidales bacterium]
MKQEILNKSREYFPEVVAIRRQLHQHPELSFCEKDTAELIKRCLSSKNIEFQSDIAGHGIIATIKGTKKTPHSTLKASHLTIALRADMDALPIQETNDIPYRSVNQGVMHACGHDAHTAMLLGTALILNDLRDSFDGTIKLVFQPGEEKLPGGASLILDSGTLNDVQLIIGQHVTSDLKCGEVGFHSGPYMASCDEVNILIKGAGGHGAKPNERNQTVVAAAKTVTRLAEMYPENDETVYKSNGLLSFGEFLANGTYNVVPSQVSLKGTMRTFDENKRKLLKDNILKMANETASEHGCTAEVFIETGYPSVKNDERLTDFCKKTAAEYLCETDIKTVPQQMTAEDFGWYSQKIPACFYRLGTADPDKAIDSMQHTSTFNIDENAMQLGTGLMAFIAINILKDENIISPRN